MARKGTRRGNNEGSIFQTKDGKWLGQVTIGYKEDGKPKRKTFTGRTRAEVATKMASDLNTVLKNGYKTVSNEKFGTLFTDWLLIFKRNTIQGRSFDRLYMGARKHIIPDLQDFKLDEMNVALMQRYINGLYQKGLCLDTIRKTKQVIAQFFEYAIDNDMVIKNPMSKIKIQKRDKHIQEKEHYKAIPIEVREDLMNALNKSEFLYPLCLTMWCAGLRIGEVLALKWRDIDFERKLIGVNNAITVDVKMDALGRVTSRKTVIADTKTACSVRVVPMPDKLYDALEKWKENRYLDGKMCGKNFITNDSLVFGDEQGNVRTYRATDNNFKRFLKRMGFGDYKFHFHAFRQTFSNMMFENNVNPKMTQALLGHKDVKTTIMNYNSVDQVYFDKTRNLINEQCK